SHHSSSLPYPALFRSSVRTERAVFELSVELAELAADFAGSGVEVSVDAPAAWRVPVAAVRPLYLVAAEAVHNAVRHARATLVEIELREDGEGFVALGVRDDGRGFDPDGVTAGVGLTTMREHAIEAGGDLDLRSGPGGTTILIRVPASAGAATTVLETTT